MHLAYIWIVSHLSAQNYQNRWKFDEVLTKTNLLSFFGDTVYNFDIQFATQFGRRYTSQQRAIRRTKRRTTQRSIQQSQSIDAMWLNKYRVKRSVENADSKYSQNETDR